MASQSKSGCSNEDIDIFSLPGLHISCTKQPVSPQEWLGSSGPASKEQPPFLKQNTAQWDTESTGMLSLYSTGRHRQKHTFLATFDVVALNYHSMEGLECSASDDNVM